MAQPINPANIIVRVGIEYVDIFGTFQQAGNGGNYQVGVRLTRPVGRYMDINAGWRATTIFPR